MRRLACLLLILASTCQATQAATLEAELNPPKYIGGKRVTATGPMSLVTVTVAYGTCVGTRFGTWEGGKTRDMPISKITFKDVAYRRTCGKATWKTKSGRSYTSPTDIAEAP